MDENFSKVMEAEVLRTRKGGGARALPPELISSNIVRLGRMAKESAVKRMCHQ